MIPKVLTSSDGTGNLSTTIKGVLTLLIPLIIVWGQSQGWVWTEDSLALLVQEVAVVIGGIVTIYGLAKKLRNR